MKKQILTLCLFAFSFFTKAGTPFITRWDLHVNILMPIIFKSATSGPVSYSWETIPAGQSGSGTFSGYTTGPDDTIPGLPVNAIIRLKIEPTNFSNFKISYACASSLLDIEQWGSTPWKSMQNAFSSCTNLNISAIDTPNLQNVINMSGMFGGCEKLNTLASINSWNTSNVKDMSGLFSHALLFNLPIDNWDVSKVTTMSYMFNGAYVFNQPIGNWDVGKVKDMSYMFDGTYAFNQPIGNWNVSNVNDMSYMFSSTVYNSPLANWDVSSVNSFLAMFSGSGYFNQPINSWHINNNVTELRSMFNGASSFNQPLDSWNVSNITNMEYMFRDASSFNQPLDSWNTSKLQYMDYMFENASAYNQISISKWNLQSIILSMFNTLDFTAIDCNTYATILHNLANNPLTPDGLYFGVANIPYGNNALTDRDYMTFNKHWGIHGDIYINNTCYPTAIANVANMDNAISIYPNPSTSQATLAIQSTQTDAVSITIYNTLGQQVFADNIKTTQGKNLYNLPYQALGNGIYTVCIAINNTKAVKQWVISNG